VSVVGVGLGNCCEVLAGGNLDLLLLAHLRGPAWALVLMSLGVVVVVEMGVGVATGVLVFTLARSWVGWDGLVVALPIVTESLFNGLT
jgi:hypothetical protein